MNATNYARLAGAIFAVVAVLQLLRALSGWPITIGSPGVSIPLWASWLAVVVAGGLAWLGLLSLGFETVQSV